MEKIIVYGYGMFYERNKRKLAQYDIVAYANSSPSNNQREKDGKRILSPVEINDIEYDYVFICTDVMYSSDIYFTLLYNNVGADKIKFLNRIDTINGVWDYVATKDNKALLSDIGGIKIEERYKTDFEITGEVFYNNIYGLSLPIEKYIVLDIGMNIGAATLFFAAQSCVSKVYSYEPFEDTYNQAMNNFSRNEEQIAKKIYANNCALYDENKIEIIDAAMTETGWRSVVCGSDNNGQRIEFRDAGAEVCRIVQENSGEKIVLKIDTEGSEYKIFKSLQREKCFKHIEAIVMEYHRGVDGLVEILRENNFKYFINGSLKDCGMIYAVK